MALFFSTCVKTNSYIQNVDTITNVVQDQPHQHIPHLELIKTGPTGTDHREVVSKAKHIIIL